MNPDDTKIFIIKLSFTDQAERDRMAKFFNHALTAADEKWALAGLCLLEEDERQIDRLRGALRDTYRVLLTCEVREPGQTVTARILEIVEQSGAVEVVE